MKQDCLRLSVVTAMKQTLAVTLCRDVHQAECAVHPYTAQVKVLWSPDEGPDVDLDELSELSHMQVQGYLPELFKFLPETVSIPVGLGRFALADLSARECFGQLVLEGMDLGLVAQSLMGDEHDLSPLRSRYPGARERVLIADSMVIDEQWRGAGYGLLATDLVIRELGDVVDLVALYPMRPGLADLEQRAASHRALSAYWAQIGFEEFDDIMVRDLRR